MSKLQLNFWERIIYHIPSIGFFIAGLIPLFYGGFYDVVFVMLFISAAMYFWQESKLSLTPIGLDIDYMDAVRTIVDTAEREGWVPAIDFETPGTKMEFTKHNWAGNSNDIVIIFEKNRILVNARGSYPTDKKIINKIRTALQVRTEEIQLNGTKTPNPS